MPTEGVRLRRLRWWDVAALMPVEVDVFAGWAWSAETFWSELAAPGRWYVAAVTDGDADRLVGYAGLAVPGPDADVQTIAVYPDAQGRGVGALLLRGLVGEAARRGCSSVLLEVRADNPSAIRLYERHGFERIAVRRRYYQPGDVDAHIMRLRPVPAVP